MRGLLPLKNGVEEDAFSRRSRHLLHWQRGELKKLKRYYHKRERAHARKVILQERD